jgi:hypothetical protein
MGSKLSWVGVWTVLAVPSVGLARFSSPHGLLAVSRSRDLSGQSPSEIWVSQG